MSPLISIIVPIYNVEAYLSRCLDSILAQSYKNLEILLIDDGSKDSSGAICDDYARKDGRIKVYHKQNAGVSSARNFGLDVFSGEYLMFVDSDDTITENAVELLYQRIRQDDSDMAVGLYRDLQPDGSSKKSYATWNDDAVLTREEAFNRLGIQGKDIHCALYAKLYHKHVWQNIRLPENMRVAEDLWVFPQVIETCEKISLVAQPIYYYLQNATSLFHSKNTISYINDIHSSIRMIHILLDKGLLPNAQTFMSRCIVLCLESRSPLPLGKAFRKAFAPQELKALISGLSPRNKRRWIALSHPRMRALILPIWRIIHPKKKKQATL